MSPAAEPTQPLAPVELGDWFWTTIASADGDVPRMREILTTMALADLRRFHYDLEDAVAELLDEPFTRYLTRNSEDGATDVAYWAVSQGRAYYEALYDHPETIPEHVEYHPAGVLHDGITLAVYEDRTGEMLPDRPDDEDEDEQLETDGRNTGRQRRTQAADALS